MESTIKQIEEEKAKLTAEIEKLNGEIVDRKAKRKKLERALELLKK